MASRDDKRVDAGILEDPSFVGCAVAEAELLRGMTGARPRCRADAGQRGIASCLERWHEGSGGEDSGTEQAHRNTIHRDFRRRGVTEFRNQLERRRFIANCGVLNYDPKKRLAGLAGDQLVRAGRTLDGKTMSNQRTDFYFLLRQELQKGLQVASFSPAHVADGVVAAFLLIRGIVAAGAVRAGNAKVEFFFVKRLALNVDADGAHRHDDGALAGDGAR